MIEKSVCCKFYIEHVKCIHVHCSDRNKINESFFMMHVYLEFANLLFVLKFLAVLEMKI